MSKVAIQGATTGTGVFTLASPATDTDRTLTLPDEAGTVLTTATPGVPVNGPAFSAVLGSNQTVTTSVSTKLQFNTEEFDTNACYDTSTYRFTPNVAGYYQVTANAYTSTSQNYNQLQVYKNGVIYKTGPTNSTTGAYMFNVACLVYLNGSTDYIELYGITVGGTPVFYANSLYTYFQVALERAA